MTNHCAPFYRQSLLWFPKWRAVLIGTEASGDGEAVEMPTMLTAWSISRGRSMGPDGSKSDCWSCNGNSPVWQFLLAGVSCCHIPLVVAATPLIAGEAGSPAPMWTQRLPKGQYQQQFRPYWLQNVKKWRHIETHWLDQCFAIWCQLQPGPPNQNLLAAALFWVWYISGSFHDCFCGSWEAAQEILVSIFRRSYWDGPNMSQPYDSCCGCESNKS